MTRSMLLMVFLAACAPGATTSLEPTFVPSIAGVESQAGGSPSPDRSHADAALTLLRNQFPDQPWHDSLTGARMDGETVVIETSLQPDEEGRRSAEAICEALVEIVAPIQIDGDENAVLVTRRTDAAAATCEVHG